MESRKVEPFHVTNALGAVMVFVLCMAPSGSAYRHVFFVLAMASFAATAFFMARGCIREIRKDGRRVDR